MLANNSSKSNWLTRADLVALLDDDYLVDGLMAHAAHIGVTGELVVERSIAESFLADLVGERDGIEARVAKSEGGAE